MRVLGHKKETKARTPDQAIEDTWTRFSRDVYAAADLAGRLNAFPSAVFYGGWARVSSSRIFPGTLPAEVEPNEDIFKLFASYPDAATARHVGFITLYGGFRHTKRGVVVSLGNLENESGYTEAAGTQLYLADYQQLSPQVRDSLGSIARRIYNETITLYAHNKPDNVG